MVDGGHDKAGVGQCLHDVIVPAEPAAAAVETMTSGSFVPVTGQSFTP